MLAEISNLVKKALKSALTHLKADHERDFLSRYGQRIPHEAFGFDTSWPITDEGFTMAKSKDHMAHNQSYKAHKNNIKKPMRGCQTSTKGVLNKAHDDARSRAQNSGI
ncbi:60S ribosomal protein L29-1 [Zea mays]|uniref:60S ribosomal protein L29 n=1 Tax=Zea mays TaxID=4577 RepID=A0A1D6HX31_MAIZE|nr:60S ribosomal protein L29-1 [Zea mays]